MIERGEGSGGTGENAEISDLLQRDVGTPLWDRRAGRLGALETDAAPSAGSGFRIYTPRPPTSTILRISRLGLF